MNISLLHVVLILAYVATSMAWADIVVIANPANPNVLTHNQVNRIFLGKSRSFPDGTIAKPVDQVEGQSARQEFVESVLGQTESSLKSYWSTLVFTGNGFPPETLTDDQAVKKFVNSNPKALGYIDRKSVDASVKVVWSPEKNPD